MTLCALQLTLQNQPEDFSKNTNVNIENFLRYVLKRLILYVTDAKYLHG